MVDETWTVEKGYNKANQYVEDMEIPFLKIENNSREDITFGNLSEASNTELQEYLSVSGAWLAFVELNLAALGAKKGAYETAFETGMKVEKANLAEEYLAKGTRKPTIDEMEGIILRDNKRLNTSMKTLIEIRAAYDKLLGRKEAFKGLFNTSSRVLSARSLESGRG
jgi:hypothetical protein|tara:strand:+ start:11944 stop:12444 length:501 start_codon:yes stop_codon:yes gene_type:complete